MFLKKPLRKLSAFLVLFYSVTIVSCSPGSSPTPPPNLSSEKTINTFVFDRNDNLSIGSNVSGIITGDTIKVLLPGVAVSSNLIPDISFTGKTISPANRLAQDFSKPVSYTVTAEDGSTKKFVVVTNTASDEATLFINSRHVSSGVGSIYAINPQTGKLKWKYVSTSDGLVSSIQFSKGVLFTGIGTNITAFDTVTKSIKWQCPAGGVLYSTPTIKNGVLYFNCDDNFLYAVNELTGILLWKYQQDTPSSPGGNYSSPTVVDGVVYFGSLSGYIYAVNATSGVLKWKTLGSSGIRMHSSPSVVNNVLYVADLSNNLMALNTNDGSIKWNYSFLNGGGVSSPTVVDGVVYICSDIGGVFAFDANSGVLIWRYNINLGTDSSPIVSNGVLYVGAGYGGSSRNFYAINTDNGSLKWSKSAETGYFSSAVVFDGIVYVGTWPDVLAFNASNGSLKWKFTPPSNGEQFWPSPCIVDKQGNVFLASICGSKD